MAAAPDPSLRPSPPGEPVAGAARAGMAGVRMLPQAVEAEESLLACCMLDGPDTVARCIEEKIGPESFYVPAHRTLFEIIMDLNQRGQPTDYVVLAEELRNRRQLDAVGGAPFLSRITGRVATTAQAGYFIGRVRDTWLLRELIRTSTSAVERAHDFSGDFDQFIESVEQEIFQVTQKRVADNAKDIKTSVDEAVATVEKMIYHKGETTGIPSGFHDLDRLTYGFHRKDMIVLAARPSIGKTALALNFVEHAVLPQAPGREPVPTLIFSLEMGHAQLAQRMICSRSRVRFQQLRDGVAPKESFTAIVAAADEVSKAPVKIDDSGQMTILQMRAKARRLHARHNLGLIVVDYLQLVSGTDPRAPREQQVAEISRGMKAMAKELDLPVIVLSQLNRESEKDNRLPRLSDLRESGAIEQDADVVLLLARPKGAESDFQVAGDVAEVIVAKHRNGPVGQFKLTFLREITRFENFSP